MNKSKEFFGGVDDVAAAAQASSSSVSTISDDQWHLVSSFAAPPDIYNLSLSSEYFHTSASKTTGTNGTRKKGSSTTSSGSKDKASRAGSRASSAAAQVQQQQPVLATRLLRSSLLSSLNRTLEHSGSGITLESVLAIADLPIGSALIAGSTMAQTCLGVLWRGDVDVYCSAKGAPQVRSWLVEQAKCMFVGFNDYRIEMCDDRLAYTVDTKIHHVEQYSSIAEELEMLKYRLGRRSGRSQERGGADMDSDALDQAEATDYYKEACEWGEECMYYAFRKWRHAGIDSNEAYNIKPKPGGALPFDFEGYGRSIDLIVARTDERMKLRAKGKSSKKNKTCPAEITPFDLLEDFDLTICKASFDGKTFRIPEPHLTFARKTTMESHRRAVVESYIQHFKASESGYRNDPFGQANLARATIKAVRKEVPDAPFYKLIDAAELLPDPYTGERSFSGQNPWRRGIDELVRAMDVHGPWMQFHNWTKKLVDRLRKYQQRDIEVIGAPMIGGDVHLQTMTIIN